jgi:hypothetical protein
MPPANPGPTKQAFFTALGDAVSLSVDCRSFRLLDVGGAPVSIGRQRVELIAGFACLRMHLAWEDFLEEVFVRYLCGAQPPGSPGPVLLQPPCGTISAARVVLLGGQDFVSWNRKTAKKRARRYFDGGYGFTAGLTAAAVSIDTLEATRNAVAHRSPSASRVFRLRAQAHLGFLPRGLTPGGFLARTDPRAPNRRIVESLAADLRAAANTIVP